MIELETQPVAIYLDAVRALKATRDPKVAAALIREHGLPREVVPTELLTEKLVWEALLENMPATALIRNLATMTRVGLIAPLSAGTKTVVEKLSDHERLVRARVHPIAILLALKTYEAGRTQAPGLYAHNVRTRLGISRSGGIAEVRTWTPVPQVIDALDAAFYASFAGVVPTGDRILVALDVSGSMNAPITNSIMTCTEAGAAMALVLGSTEPQSHIIAFDTGTHEFAISKRQRLDDVVKRASRYGGGTDVAQPILYATNKRMPVDAFVILTDSETWAGRTHAQVALEAYRKKMSLRSKLVVMSTAANTTTVGDVKDPLVLNTTGFDAAAPQVLNAFLKL